MSLDGNLTTSESNQTGVQEKNNLPTENASPKRAKQPKKGSLMWVTLFAFVLPIIALFPLLFLAGQALWSRSTFQFYPASILLGFVFLFATCKWQPAGRSRSHFSLGTSLVGIGVGIVGMVLVSPTWAHLAFVFISLGWALGVFGGTAWTRVVAILSLFAITVPLPFAFSFRLQDFLFRLSGMASSAFLETVRFPNVLEYNVIRIEGKQLNLTEVLLDAGSCFALAACALAWMVYRQKPAIISLIIVASSFFWAFLLDSVRLLAIAICFRTLNIDLSIGVLSIAMSVLTFLLATACILLTDAFFTEALAPINPKKQLDGLSEVYEKWVTWPTPSSTNQENSSTARPARVGWLIGANAISLPMGILCLWVIFIRPQPEFQDLSMSQATIDMLPGKTSLPEQIGPLKLANFLTNSTDAKKNNRVQSRFWQYKSGETQIVVSLEFPYSTWNSMVDEYRLMGWAIENAVKENKDSPAAWTLEQVNMQNSFGIRAYSCIAFFDQSGNPIVEEFPQAKQGRNTLWTMMRSDSKLQRTQRRFRVRLFLETGREISVEEATQYRSFFIDIFDRIRNESSQALSQLK